MNYPYAPIIGYIESETGMRAVIRASLEIATAA